MTVTEEPGKKQRAFGNCCPAPGLRVIWSLPACCPTPVADREEQAALRLLQVLRVLLSELKTAAAVVLTLGARGTAAGEWSYQAARQPAVTLAARLRRQHSSQHLRGRAVR